MQSNFSILKNFIVEEKDTIMSAEGMKINISLSGTPVYKREHD